MTSTANEVPSVHSQADELDGRLSPIQESTSTPPLSFLMTCCTCSTSATLCMLTKWPPKATHAASAFEKATRADA